MSFSDYAENLALRTIFTTGAIVRPAALYAALFKTDPGETGTGTEVSGGAYVRMPITFTVAGSVATQTATIDFPTATAAWGTITHVGIYDAAVGGNLIDYGAVPTSRSIQVGDIVRLAAGAVTISLE